MKNMKVIDSLHSLWWDKNISGDKKAIRRSYGWISGLPRM
jgi:hypothetical protein